MESKYEDLESYTFLAIGLQANTFTYCQKCNMMAYADTKESGDRWVFICHHCKEEHIRENYYDTPEPR